MLPFQAIGSPVAAKVKGRVLFVGHSYYHTWYLAQELRKLGWRADVLNWDENESSQMYYHNEDFRFYQRGMFDRMRQLKFFLQAIRSYDIFHFSNMHGLCFGRYVHALFSKITGEYSEIRFLKKLGKKIVYSNNCCMDGVSQTSFSKWGPESVCSICSWSKVPSICSDENNLKWGLIRNKLADYQITVGGNRADYNDNPVVHEVPQFYCLDPDYWKPELEIPAILRLPYPEDTVKIYHAVGNFESRTFGGQNKNIKCTHIYLPLIERLKKEGYKVELIFVHDVPNKQVRYYQAQADIVVDMLTFGWFGANIREGMMLGKPCVCFLRPEWIESVRQEIPDYIKELPVVNATPQTVHEVLKDLLEHPEKRREIGIKSRAFAVKWHSSVAGAKKMEQIYLGLLDKRIGRERAA